MRRMSTMVVVLTALMFMVLTQTAFAQDDKLATTTLRGLSGVCVFVTMIDPSREWGKPPVEQLPITTSEDEKGQTLKERLREDEKGRTLKERLRKDEKDEEDETLKERLRLKTFAGEPPGKQLRTDVELSLKRAGIRVLTWEEAAEVPGAPYLDVYVQIMKLEVPLDVYVYSLERGVTLDAYAYYVDIQLYQDVFLLREPTLVVSASTWSDSALGRIGPKGLADDVQSCVQNMMYKFLNAWRAANPKK